MTPKEKAKELICKMSGYEKYTDINDIYIQNQLGYYFAKECALNAANEIIDSFPFELTWIAEGKNYIKYWNNVKTEIEKL